MAGTLYLVATPIGNLQDITLRALETLRTVDIIACEDTRHTRKLLNHFNIAARTRSYHGHNERSRSLELVDELLDGKSVAVVSDAGTPGICDPGFHLIKRAIDAGVRIVPIPGPVAFVSAAIASGLITDELYFGGFLPAKKGERRKRLEKLGLMPVTIVVYEAPHRLLKTLSDCLDILTDRRVAVARELTKLHEEIFRGTISEAIRYFSENGVKGEIVLVFEAHAVSAALSVRQADTLNDRVAELIDAGADQKAALKQAAKEFQMSKSSAYRRLLEERLAAESRVIGPARD